MLKRNSKSILGLILVITLVFSMFPTLPSSVAYAAVTNLLPSTLTLNGNIKASSQNGTRSAVNIGNSVTWTLGANGVYTAITGGSPNNLWVAIDLGSSSNIEGLNFHTTANDVNTIARSSQYEVSYSNDETPLTSPWNKLTSSPSNNPITFSPSANGWTSAAVVPTNIATGTVTNATYSWSRIDPTDPSSYYTSNLTFTAPIKARYILINYTLKTSATGQLGIGLLQILPPVTLSSSSGSFYKTLQNTVSTQINLDTSTSFTNITNGSYTLVQGTDYTFDTNSNVVTFSKTYLSSLNGSYNLSFNFSSSHGTSSLPYILTVAAAADSSLSPQGAAYIPLSPSTISTTMNLNGNNFTNISEGTTVLPLSAYVVSDNTVTFNQSYLNTLSLGVHAFTFNFNQGNPQTYMLTLSGKPPAANIDYRYWTLQEPLPGGAGQTSQTLQDGYADPYFYIGADGSQVFMDTAVGGTTSGSAHPRSELREYDPVAGKDAGWLPAGANIMSSTVAVTALGTLNGAGWTTIGQVFDPSVTTLCELEYGYDPARPNSNIRILYEPSGINSIGYQYIPIKIPLNQYFTYRMTLNDSVLSIYINGDLIFNGKTASPSQVIPPNHLYYFKAGNYDQTATNGNVNYVPYTVVQFKSINVYHAPIVSSNADLNSLALSSGTLSPVFASGTTSYTSNVSNSVSSVTVTANVYDSNAVMTVKGIATTSGQASAAINLNVGSNVIPIVVTALNGTTKTYNVTVNRAPASSNADLSSLTLSSGALSPAFATDTTAYTSSVANGVSSLTVTGSVYSSNAMMTVNGNPVISGQASGAINLNMGSNTINIVVTAQNGTTKTYSVTVNRISSGSRSSSSGGGGSSTPLDTKVTATEGKLTLPAGKTGEVSLGKEIVVSIPPNATDKELKLTIDKVVDTQKLLTNKEVLVSQVFEILKNFSENFSNPVTLNFTFDPASLKNNQTAAVFYYDEAKKVWVEVTGSKINGNQISVEVNHFTKYAVFAVDKVTGKSTPAVNLNDIAGHWAEANIKQAVSSGIVSGYPDGTFKPNHTVTRAEFAVMLMNTLKPQGEGAALTFTDTAKIGIWAQKAVAQAFQAGIIKGYEDGSFRPDAEITRAEMAVMLANALGLTVEANTVTGFADDKDVPAWSKGAVAAMKKQKLVEGKGANEFGPTASTTRAEAVTALLNLLAQKSK
ncbi:S-layer homology domain-containing protein [Paenibacillus radicis (ex Xue et al. 2023)]|uniref:S-layer homology domain-containing protein n=1 Tax=Paenibacillus radicis (ex Xue et al. 2023) TaxID=2972489 RepID=A0ABT1YTP4_9BACL|nr:S-layer homology domain-containing protein [Paenibacillus radicis (ex Xue et al. 2023)]MCR8635355.1 S-layer homology domain-containing protein [Paenibacillus radicis (ex Xue et al. 2023)]